jgi:cell division protease FtsH
MDGRSTRFSIWYFVLAFLLLIVFNTFFAQMGREQIPYSEIKLRIAGGQVDTVRITETTIEAVPNDTIRERTGIDRWTAVMPPVEDRELMPMLAERGIPVIGARAGWFSQALIWLLPIGLLILFWIWMLRRMNPHAGRDDGGEEPRPDHGRGGHGRHVRRRRRRGRGEAGAGRGRRVPEDAGQVRAAGREDPEGRAAGRPAGHGQDAAGAGRRRRGGRHVLLDQRLGVRRDVRRRRRGAGARPVRAGEAQAPCIVFIDELDALGKQRGGGGPMGGHDEREQTLNQLLVEMDGFDPRTGVIIMAATNRPEILDQALLRPGRFDRQVLVDRPDMAGRLAILRRALGEHRALGDDVDLLETVARRTPGFVGADLANLLNEAALLAARRDKDQVDDDRHRARHRPHHRGPREEEPAGAREGAEIVAYHEAGHAIVAERAATRTRSTRSRSSRAASRRSATRSSCRRTSAT